MRNKKKVTKILSVILALSMVAPMVSYAEEAPVNLTAEAEVKVEEDSAVSEEILEKTEEVQETEESQEELIVQEETLESSEEFIADEEIPEETVELPEIQNIDEESLLMVTQETEEEKTNGKVTEYAVFLDDLKVLESYAEIYAKEHSGESETELVLNYIRNGIEKYQDGNWTLLAGEEKTAFTSYVSAQDKENGTHASDLRNLEEFEIPNGQKVDFGHMFGTMNITYYMEKTNPSKAVIYADLSGWAGDVCDLMTYTKGKVSGSIESMAAEIRQSYLGIDDPDVHTFGILDIYGDLDAFYIMKNVSSSKKISAVMSNYFNENLTDEARAKYFLKNRFPGKGTAEEIREAMYQAYKNNEMIANLESSRGLGAEDADLRIACSYAFSDYLSNLTGVLTEKENNEYYAVFSSESSTLAPGIEQQIKQATTADNKQIVYYIATADIGRSDVSIYANYKDNKGGTPWGMQRVTDQMAAAQKKHSDPEDIQAYIPNYKTIVGVNADFYNMSTGEPQGALIMEGEKYHEFASGATFFGITKDGIPVIGDKQEWEKMKDNLQEAVGGSIFLVKGGKSVVNSSSSYYKDRASRTCVGITADNKVVLMVLDGRQEPVSAGGSAQEIAQIMIDAGCVTAINLDGGGSTTYAAKSEGSDEVAVVNRPSDGYERSVSSSLVVVSTAKSSTEFEHALISTEADYLTVGTSMEVKVSGVSATGNAAELPEGAELIVSDSNVGVLENNVFTALDNGKVTLQLVANGTVLGSKTLEVVIPDGIEFTRETINAVYGVPCEMPIRLTYQGNEVAINENDVMFGFLVDGEGELESEAGEFEGFSFVGNEESGIRTIKIIALVASNEEDEIIAFATINLYKQDEAIFDFDDVTGGDRTLAWVRTVSNAKTADNQTYYVEDPKLSMDGLYTFAVDMSMIPVPEKIEPMLELLPGGDDASATAWTFLMQLAERISVLTNVQVELKVNDGFLIDPSELKIVNDYFELTKAEYEPTEHVLKMQLNFKKQSQSIDENTANPICILSGLKVLAEESATWSNDQLTAEITGKVSYDIYLRSSAVYNIASDEANQKQYDLYPFINPNEPTEKGAHFAAEFSEIEDGYTLDRTNKQGWIEENGNIYYYKDNVAMTGIQELPGYKDENNKYYYDLGQDGVSRGKISGLFDLDHEKYFAKNGILQKGWQAITVAGGSVQNYYFDNSYKAVNGIQIISGYHYEFADYVLIRGELVKDVNGIRYMWAGQFATQQWMTIDGKQYYFRSSYYAATGIYAFNIDNKNVFYVFDDDGVWLEELNGMYTDKNGDTYWIEDGIKNTYPGLLLIDGKYYYFAYESQGKLGAMVKNGTYWITKTNELMPESNYKFAEDGHMLNPKPYAGAKIIWKNEDGTILKEDQVQYEEMPVYGNDNPVKPEDTRYTYEFIGWSPEVTAVSGDAVYVAQYRKIGKSGLCVEGDATYWIKDGENVEYPGLIRTFNENGNPIYYYFDQTGKAVKNVPVGGKDYWVEKTNGLLPQWGYYFDENGVIFHDELYQNGIQKDQEGILCYYIDGIKAHMGLIQIGEDYYYVRSNGQLVVGASYYCSRMNDLKVEGTYRFDENGKMILPDVNKNGIYEENGSLYYYEKGEIVYAGLIQISDDYYYVKTNGEVVHGRNYWISKTNGLLPEKSYTFDSDGKIILPKAEKNGIYEENGSLYYYENGKLTYAGLIQIDDAYYYVKTSGEVIHGRSYWISKTNGLLPEKSYTFDETGKLIK